MPNQIIDVIQPSAPGATDEKLNLVLDLSDLTAANTTNTSTITDAITSTENTLKTHNTAIRDDIRARLGNTDSKGDIVSILTALETNMETRLTKIDDRLIEMDTKFSKILGYGTAVTLATSQTESIKGIIGDVTTLKGTFDGKGTDALADKTLTGVLQTLNDKIGDVSELKKPVMNADFTMGTDIPLEVLTLSGSQQHINTTLGDPKEQDVLVGEVFDTTSGTVINPGTVITFPDNLAGGQKASVTSSIEGWVVSSDGRLRLMNIIDPFIDAFNRMIKALQQIAQVSPRL